MRSNHAHAVVSAQAKPERIADAFKAFATKKLREENLLDGICESGLEAEVVVTCGNLGMLRRRLTMFSMGKATCLSIPGMTTEGALTACVQCVCMFGEARSAEARTK